MHAAKPRTSGVVRAAEPAHQAWSAPRQPFGKLWVLPGCFSAGPLAQAVNLVPGPFRYEGGRSAVEVKIGIQSIPRELVVETDTPADEIERALSEVLATDGALFSLAAEKGGKILVPADKIAYVEFGGNEPRRVGFGQYT